MTFIGIIVLLLIAAMFGSLCQLLTGYSDAGWVTSSVLAFAGAFIFLWLAGKFNLPPIYNFHLGGQAFPIIWALVGAGIFSLMVVVVQKAFISREG